MDIANHAYLLFKKEQTKNKKNTNEHNDDKNIIHTMEMIISKCNWSLQCLQIINNNNNNMLIIASTNWNANNDKKGRIKPIACIQVATITLVMLIII